MLLAAALGMAGAAGGVAQTSGFAVAQTSGFTVAQGTPDLPTRRPEEAQADPMQAFDVNKNGKLELAEIKSAAAARFDELNPDGDDALDEREAAPVLPGEAFRAADTDRNGTVNKAEYLAYVEQMFNVTNPDRDGSLDRAELDSKNGQALMKMLR
jgi:Ca2+-binding EF-hand superfamily protein